MDRQDTTRILELARDGAHGREAALNELLRRHAPRVRRHVMRKLAPWQRARIDPDDVLQETLLVAARRLPEVEVRTPAGFYRWLARIAELEIKEELEHLCAAKRDPARERRLRADEGDGSDTGVVVPSVDPTPSQVVARRELVGRIDRCVEELEPAEYRDVIRMRDFRGADWEAIRAAMGRPSVAAVKDLLHRARRRLGERLGIVVRGTDGA